MQAAETEIQGVSLSDSLVPLRCHRIWCWSSGWAVHCTLHAACRQYIMTQLPTVLDEW